MLVVLALLACDRGPTWNEEVGPIVLGRCASCHTEGGVGPFPLDSYEGASEVHELVAAAVSSGAMPPWGASHDGPDYENDWSLTADQVEAIVAWSEAGAPEGPAKVEPEALPYIGTTLTEVDLSIDMPEAYSPVGDGRDDYRCFVLDWPGDATTWVTGFNARPGNLAVVHHLAVFLMSSDNLLGDELFSSLDEWDAAEEGPGYTCFGGPSGAGADFQVPAQQLAQWVPGNQGWDFPEGTGISVPAGSKIVLQVHYNLANAEGADATDLTGVDFRLADEVDHPAAFAPWLDGLWPLGNMPIPAGDDDIDHEVVGDPRGFFEFLAPDLDLSGGFLIHSAMLHMHTRGQGGTVEVHHQDGALDPVLEVPDYDFHWQLGYVLDDPITVEPGDELRLQCRWDNSAEGALELNWGEGTGDEMCVANLYISQR